MCRIASLQHMPALWMNHPMGLQLWNGMPSTGLSSLDR